MARSRSHAVTPAAELCAHVRLLSPDRTEAWFGLLQTHSEVTKALDADLIANHRLSLSAHELLFRLAVAEDGYLRMSQLAERALLSQSRVSRIVDQLEARGLIERRPCPVDSRVVHAVITFAGRELLREAQETHLQGIEEHFFAKLTDTEVAQLARVFEKLHGRDGGC